MATITTRNLASSLESLRAIFNAKLEELGTTVSFIQSAIDTIHEGIDEPGVTIDNGEDGPEDLTQKGRTDSQLTYFSELYEENVVIKGSGLKTGDPEERVYTSVNAPGFVFGMNYAPGQDAGSLLLTSFNNSYTDTFKSKDDDGINTVESYQASNVLSGNVLYQPDPSGGVQVAEAFLKSYSGGFANEIKYGSAIEEFASQNFKLVSKDGMSVVGEFEGLISQLTYEEGMLDDNGKKVFESMSFSNADQRITDGLGDLLLGEADVNELISDILSGNDKITITEAFGRDLIGLVRAGGGNDTVNGSSSTDKMLGERGNHRLMGQGGDDSLDGGAGMDMLDGGSGDDELAGGSGKDTLLGGDGNDYLGGDEAEVFTGISMADVLNGGAGNDILDGYGGADTLTGGTGSDEFQFWTEEGGLTLASMDVITDFKAADGDNIAVEMPSMTYEELVVFRSFGKAAQAVRNAAGDVDETGVVLAQVGNDTFVFVNSQADDSQAYDYVVRLTGVKLDQVASRDFSFIDSTETTV